MMQYMVMQRVWEMQAERMAGPRMSPRHHTRGLPCSPRPRHSLPRPLHMDTGAGSSLRSLAPGPGPAQPRRCRHRYLCCRSGGRGTHRQPKLVILLHIITHVSPPRLLYRTSGCYRSAGRSRSGQRGRGGRTPPRPPRCAAPPGGRAPPSCPA